MPDLCVLADVKQWLGITDSSSDSLLSRLISAVSADFLNEIKRPELTPAADYTDTIFRAEDLRAHEHMADGYNYYRRARQEIWLRRYPVNSIASVTVNGNVISEVTDPTTDSGWWFDATRQPEDRQKVFLIGHWYPVFAIPWTWMPNVVVGYNGGYANVPVSAELATIPGTSPYTIAVAGLADFLSDSGVKYQSSGIALAKVTGVPTVGQYAVDSAGNYTFAAADHGVTVAISYQKTGVPSPIRQAIVEWVSFRRGQSQLQQLDQSAGGVKIGDYEQTSAASLLTSKILAMPLPDTVQRVIDQYRRPVI